MDQKQFLKILRKYRAGQATEEERRLIDQWYKAMGSDKLEDETLSLHHFEQVYWSNISDRLQLSNNMDARLDNAPDKRSVNRTFTLSRLAVAASVVLIMITCIYIYQWRDHEKEKLANIDYQHSDDWKEVRNTSDTAQFIDLPDGSSILLEPRSIAKYEISASRPTRRVVLKGMGFFSVERDEQRPFIVYTKGLTTKVLGTSFTVRAFPADEGVQVSVKTGKVSVLTGDKSESNDDEVILTANQEIIYNTAKKQIQRKIVKTPVPIIAEEELVRMRFEDAPVADIFNAIQKVYGVEIVFDQKIFTSCTLTTSVADGDLYSRLDIVTKAIGAHYEIVEGTIVIHGEGCD